VLTILKAVAGMEINGRHEIQFIPSHNEVTAPNELLSAASKWMADGCDGEDEESEAFDNCATCGMGWTENGMSYDDDPSGLYREESINPLEMYWDHSVRKKNLDGAQRLLQLKARDQQLEQQKMAHEQIMQRQQMAHDQQMGQGQLENDRAATQASVAKDQASTHRDRVGAIIDAMQPIQTDESLNAPPEKAKAK
jgi:hypothetical protein